MPVANASHGRWAAATRERNSGSRASLRVAKARPCGRARHPPTGAMKGHASQQIRSDGSIATRPARRSCRQSNDAASAKCDAAMVAAPWAQERRGAVHRKHRKPTYRLCRPSDAIIRALNTRSSEMRLSHPPPCGRRSIVLRGSERGWPKRTPPSIPPRCPPYRANRPVRRETIRRRRKSISPRALVPGMP